MLKLKLLIAVFTCFVISDLQAQYGSSPFETKAVNHLYFTVGGSAQGLSQSLGYAFQAYNFQIGLEQHFAQFEPIRILVFTGRPLTRVNAAHLTLGLAGEWRSLYGRTQIGLGPGRLEEAYLRRSNPGTILYNEEWALEYNWLLSYQFKIEGGIQSKHIGFGLFFANSAVSNYSIYTTGIVFSGRF